MTNLPPFAKQWAQQWKSAGPALQAIRDQELRQLDGERTHGNAAGHRLYDRFPERHGMVTMQKWLLRRALLQKLNLSGDISNSIHLDAQR